MRGARVGLKAGARLLASAGEGGGQLGRGAGAGPGGEGDGLRVGEGKWAMRRAERLPGLGTGERAGSVLE